MNPDSGRILSDNLSEFGGNSGKNGAFYGMIIEIPESGKERILGNERTVKEGTV